MNNNNATSTLNDCYHVGGKYFPVPDENTAKGQELGAVGLTGGQSDKQKSPRQNAQDGPNQPTVRVKEGKSFRVNANGKESSAEEPTFAGQRSDVGVSLQSGQIVSEDNSRLVPVPLPDQADTIRARMKFKKTRADAKENRI